MDHLDMFKNIKENLKILQNSQRSAELDLVRDITKSLTKYSTIKNGRAGIVTTINNKADAFNKTTSKEILGKEEKLILKQQNVIGTKFDSSLGPYNKDIPAYIKDEINSDISEEKHPKNENRTFVESDTEPKQAD